LHRVGSSVTRTSNVVAEELVFLLVYVRCRISYNKLYIVKKHKNETFKDSRNCIRQRQEELFHVGRKFLTVTESNKRRNGEAVKAVCD